MGKKKTHEEFTKEVVNLVGDEYTLLNEYVTAHDKIKLIHNPCKHIYQVKPNNFLKGQRCPNCSRSGRKKSSNFEQAVFDLVGDEYKVLEEYTHSLKKIEIKHEKCGHIYKATPSYFLSGNRCPKCKNEWSRKSHDRFLSEVKNITNGEYIVLSDYRNNYTKINLLHLNCEYVFATTPKNFLKGRRCPKCNESKGRKRITDYLSLLNIRFEIEQKIPECRNIYELPFDVEINSNILVEYDGEGHFEPFRYSKDKRKMELKLKSTQKNDKIKNNFCMKNNVPLVRIPYWEFNNIEYILEHVLGYFKLTDKQDVDESLVYKFLVNHPDWSHEKYLEQANQN